MSGNYDEHILEFELKNGFAIEKAAKEIVRMMREVNMDAVLQIPGGVTFEIDRDCTANDIVDGYKEFIKSKISKTLPSNSNDKPSLKPV